MPSVLSSELVTPALCLVFPHRLVKLCHLTELELKLSDSLAHCGVLALKELAVTLDRF